MTGPRISEMDPIEPEDESRLWVPVWRADTTLPAIQQSGRVDISAFNQRQNVGLFTELAGQTVSATPAPRLRSAGYSVPGIGAADLYYDETVTPTWLAAGTERARYAFNFMPTPPEAYGPGYTASLLGLTPFQVGCLGDGVTDDAEALQAYYDICRDTDIGFGDVAGKFRSSEPITYGDDDNPPQTRNFRGIMDLTATAGTGDDPLPHLFRINNLTMGLFEGWRMVGSFTGSSASRAWLRGVVVGVILDNCQRLSIRQHWYRHFQMAGLTTLSNTSLSHYGFVKASDCGSGARSSRAVDATRYGFTDTFSSPVQTGNSGTSGQSCILTYTDGPPEWTSDERFSANVDALGLSIRLTDNSNVTRRYPVQSVDTIKRKGNLTTASTTVAIKSEAFDVGATVEGTYIVPGTTIASITDADHIELSAAVSYVPSNTKSTIITFTAFDGVRPRSATLTYGSLVAVVANAANINVGDAVSGTYIAPGTVVDDVTGLNITLSQAHTYEPPSNVSANMVFGKPGTISIAVWPDQNTNYAVAADYCVGGPMLITGSDSNVVSFDKIDAIRCGNAGSFHSLYLPTTGGAIVGQICGSAIALGRYNTSGFGTNLSVYTEGCIEDVVMAPPFSANSYHILFNEYALSLARCYVEAVPRRDDNTLVESSMGWRNGRFSLGGTSHKFEKSPYGASSGANPATIVLDRTDLTRNFRQDTLTLKFQLDADLHRQTGYSGFTINVRGDGTNPNDAPTSVQVDVPTKPTGCTLNGGAVSVTFTGFPGPTRILGEYLLGQDGTADLKVWRDTSDRAPPGIQTTGNASKTLSVATSTEIQEWTAVFTADRGCTLPAPGRQGRFYRVNRASTATGAFNLLVKHSSGATLATLNAVSTWVLVYDNGTAYQVIATGAY
jgi:hypothetical protein